MRLQNQTRTGNICNQNIAWEWLHFGDRFRRPICPRENDHLLHRSASRLRAMSGSISVLAVTEKLSEQRLSIPNEPEGGAPTPANLAERTRGGAGKRNATRCAPFWSKRTRRISRTVARFGRTNPSTGQTKRVPSYSIRKFYARPPPVASVSLV